MPEGIPPLLPGWSDLFKKIEKEQDGRVIVNHLNNEWEFWQEVGPSFNRLNVRNTFTEVTYSLTNGVGDWSATSYTTVQPEQITPEFTTVLNVVASMGLEASEQKFTGDSE